MQDKLININFIIKKPIKMSYSLYDPYFYYSKSQIDKF